MNIVGIIVISVVVMTIINMLKEAFTRLHEYNWLIFMISAALGVLLCVAFGGDIFATYGMDSSIPYLGNVITGLCCSGGSGIIFDLVKSVKDGVKRVEEIERDEE